MVIEMDNDAADAREHHRNQIPLAARLFVSGVGYDCLLANLSLGGAFVSGCPPLMVGDRVRLEFVIPGHDLVIGVPAWVRWRGDGGVGVRFDGLRAQQVWSLNQLLIGGREARSIPGAGGAELALRRPR